MKPRTLIPVLWLSLAMAMSTAFAGDGHDHGDAPPATNSSGPKRLPDGGVFLPKPAQRQISVLCFRAGRLVAVESCNRPADHMAARKLIARHTPLSAAEASAEGFELKAFEAATREAA
jgi:hypothetical protein